MTGQRPVIIFLLFHHVRSDFVEELVIESLSSKHNVKTA